MWTKPSVLYFLSLKKYCYYRLFVILISGIFWVINLKYTNAGLLKTVKYQDVVLGRAIMAYTGRLRQNGVACVAGGIVWVPD